MWNSSSHWRSHSIYYIVYSMLLFIISTTKQNKFINLQYMKNSQSHKNSTLNKNNVTFKMNKQKYLKFIHIM